MKRLAIFVEGYTEVQFVERLFTVIATPGEYALEVKKISGGGATSGISKTIRVIKAASKNSTHQFYVLIFDCGGDALVKQRISDEHDSLTKAGYSQIIGVRDVFPDFDRSKIADLRRSLLTRIKGALAPVDFILGVMEVEAWFLAEHTHFLKISNQLTEAAIIETLGFNPRIDDTSLRDNPASDLDKIYKIDSKNYVKGANTTHDALDFDKFYFELSEKIPDLGSLVKHLDNFLAKPGAGTA